MYSSFLRNAAYFWYFVALWYFHSFIHLLTSNYFHLYKRKSENCGYENEGYRVRVILFHEFWKSPLQLVNTTVFLKSKQYLLKTVFSKMQIDQRKRLFVAERTTSKIFIFSKQVNMGIKRSVFSSLIQRRKRF